MSRVVTLGGEWGAEIAAKCPKQIDRHTDTPEVIKDGKYFISYIFSSPRQSPGRAIVLVPASALASSIAKC